jgi:cell division protein FtsI/penicillin-binding protein 2
MTRTRSSGAHAASHRAPRTGSPASGTRVGGTEAPDAQAPDAQAREAWAPDGQVRDGQVRDGQVRDGQVRDGQVRDGQVRDGQVRDGQVREAWAPDGQAPDGQAAGGQTRNAADAPAWRARAADAEARDGQAGRVAGGGVAGRGVAGGGVAGRGVAGGGVAGGGVAGGGVAGNRILGDRITGTGIRGAGDAARLTGERAASAVRALRSRPRTAAVAGAALVLLVGLLLGGGAPDPPAEQTVQAFLLAWESGQYRTAASLTTGNQKVVADELAGAYRQLDAVDLVLGMAAVSQHGGLATASFDASVNLGRGGQPWNYRGAFTLRRDGASWKVVWSPAVIAPGLRAGQRLAVVTTLPRRAQLLDATGRPLAQPSLAYVAGVRPGALKHPSVTADDLARATGLPASQMLGQILAAPSATFLKLVHLRPRAYHRLYRKLRKIPGLMIRQTTTRLFDSIAPAISGSVGTETAKVLRMTGAPYRPGTTVGLSGLQQAFQHALAGTPTTEVVVLNAAGNPVTVLSRWPGHRGTAVRTTIDSATQHAADKAVNSLPESAAIVAIRPGGGQILAVAQHKAHGMPSISALAGHYRPGQTFTIVSTAALLATGFSINTPTPCAADNKVGGEVFSNDPPEPDLGTQPLFSMDFAHACGTAFVGASLNLNARELTAAAGRFGIGASWQLPLPSFSGTLQSPTDYAQLAADSIGAGSVRISPLDMALAAGLVQSGSWHSPTLVTGAGDPGLAPREQFRSGILAQLRVLMRSAVRAGAGRPASVPGHGIYGQVGSVPMGQGKHGLQASWFVGFRAGLAFAVLVFSRSPGDTAAHVAGQFMRELKSGS